MAIMPDIVTVLPELFLACLGMLILIFGVFHQSNKDESTTQKVSILTLLSFIVVAIILIFKPQAATFAFNDLFYTNAFVVFSKILILAGSFFALILSMDYMKRLKIMRFEYPVLMLFATLGMFIMVSSNDLLSFYLGLELQSLSLYVLAAFNKETTRSTESGLKYFILGALSSGLILYGSSLIYGFSGTTNFNGLSNFVGQTQSLDIGLLFGFIFLIAGIAFKISAVPFHMWTPDVYEGAPTPVTAFFAVAPKIAAFSILLRLVMQPFGDVVAQWQQVIVFISLASMVLGAIAAINQRNIKRLMAYSSISHVGFALVGLSSGSQEGVQSVLVYLAIYLVMSIGVFCCILCMHEKDRMLENIDDLSGLSKTNPFMALCIAIFMFSMAGIPPLAGFFAKFYVFMSAINAGLYLLSIIGVLASVIGAFYYLRIIKIMYFDDVKHHFDAVESKAMRYVMSGAMVLILFFFLFPSLLLDVTANAAQSLF